MRRLVLILIILPVLIGFLFFRPNDENLSTQPTVTIGDKTFTVEVADDNNERSKGLASRQSLPEDHGMLFVFENEGLHTFWMKETIIPLDMIFIKNNHIVTIHHNVQSQPNVPDTQLTRYSPRKPASYVLEIGAGLSKKYGFEEGDMVSYENIRN